MSTLEGVAKGLAGQLFTQAMGDLEREWDGIPDEDKEEVGEVLIDISMLSLRSLGGEDVSREQAHAKAAMASWGFVGASKVRQAIKGALIEAGAFLGKTLLKAVI